MEQDVRYWMLTKQEIEDMETAVADSPNDVHLWIKLAYKKMFDKRRSVFRMKNSILSQIFRYSCQIFSLFGFTDFFHSLIL